MFGEFFPKRNRQQSGKICSRNQMGRKALRPARDAVKIARYAKIPAAKAAGIFSAGEAGAKHGKSRQGRPRLQCSACPTTRAPASLFIVYSPPKIAKLPSRRKCSHGYGRTWAE